MMDHFLTFLRFERGSGGKVRTARRWRVIIMLVIVVSFRQLTMDDKVTAA